MSEKHNLYIECYHFHDLITICSIDGNLKTNIYGSKWDTNVSNKKSYYRNVFICGDYIFATFANGKDRYSNKEEDIRPTQFLVFNIEGDYIKTIETNCYIVDCCYDKINNRIIMHLNDEKQFSFLDLNGIIE